MTAASLIQPAARSRRGGPLSGAALNALSKARATTDMVSDARTTMNRLAAARRAAVLAANRAGVSYRLIAVELGVSPSAVQQIIGRAITHESTDTAGQDYGDEAGSAYDDVADRKPADAAAARLT